MRRAALLLVFLIACDDKPAQKDAGSDARAEAAAPSDASTIEAGIADDMLPDATSVELATRAKHLLEAITNDSPDLALDIFFPREGYVAARDGQDPGKSWDAKLKPQFAKSIKRIRARTKGIDRAIFVSFDIGKSITQIAPKKKDWKTPLWRVKRSVLTFTIDGKAHRLEIAEIVAWRGHWYVTKLK
ncbi:hypothetical protein BH09MYX1_BH09MYX1_39820 [soil metagenome]